MDESINYILCIISLTMATSKKCSVCDIIMDEKKKEYIHRFRYEGTRLQDKTCSQKCTLKFALLFQKGLNNNLYYGKIPDTIVGFGCSECSKECHETDWEIFSYTVIGTKIRIIEYYCSEECKIKQKEKLTYACLGCGKPVKEDKKVCGNCMTANYCSEKCQKEHWIHHKPDCKKKQLSDSAYLSMPENSRSHHCKSCLRYKRRKLKRCAGCQLYYYCSKKCQKEHWDKEHKQRCKLKTETEK